MQHTFTTIPAGARRLMLMAMLAMAACGETPTGAKPQPQPPAVHSVLVSSPAVPLVVGAAAQLTASPRSKSGQVLERAIVWQSQSPTIATVSAAGLVEALAPGEAIVTATSEGVVGRSTVTVSRVPVSMVEVREQSIALVEASAHQLSAEGRDAQGRPLPDRDVHWESLDPSIAQITPSGLVLARRAGQTAVRVTIEGVSALVAIEVILVPVDRITLSETSIAMETGDTVFVTARTVAADGSPLPGRLMYWGSSEPSVLAVASNGRFIGLSSGTVRVTVSSEGRSAEATVVVHMPPSASLMYDRLSPTGNEIFLRSPLGAETRLNAGNVSHHPSPSPNGQRIAFAVEQVDPLTKQLQQDLYIVDRNGMHMTWLTRMAGAESEPVWSPDGTRIAYSGSTNAGEAHDIYVVNVDGSGVKNLTPNTIFSYEQSPAWSPDGRSIAYASFGLIGGSHIFEMNVDGSGSRRIDPATTLNSRHPSYSPDGRSIAYTRTVANATTGMDIAVVPRQGGAERVLALAGDQVDVVWSGDARHFAFGQMLNGVWQVHTVRVDGTVPRRRAAGSNANWIVP